MQIILDRTGFPLIFVKSINAYVHALPITKIQFERYIADPNYGIEDTSTYETIIKENPRISPTTSIREKPWGLLSTGLLPKEINRFKTWLGANFDFATDTAWEKSVKWFDSLTSKQVMQAINNIQGINPLVRVTFESIYRDLSPVSGTDLCLFFGTVMEWVMVEGKLKFIGKASSDLWSHINTRDRFDTLPADERRRSYFSSFRFIKY